MEVRQRMTLLDEMSVIRSPNLQDLLRIRDEEDRRQQQQQKETLTLGSVLRIEKRDLGPSSTTLNPAMSGGSSSRGRREIAVVAAAAAVSRTLLDIIREEESNNAIPADVRPSPSSAEISSSNGNGNKVRWKSFKDRFGLSRTSTTSAAAAACSSASVSADAVISSPPEAVSTENRSSDAARGDLAMVPATSDAPPAASPARMDLAAALAAERQLRPMDGRDAATAAETPARTSLMALLEETDRQPWSVAAEGEAQMEMKVVVGGEDGREYFCCVCMVRNKGAAFIPCGHTFCRVCSRELWVSRGNCPLCNAQISEILDIF